MEKFDIKQLPAFPVNMSGPCTFAGIDIPKGGTVEWGGISIRDYFAAKAMPIMWDAYDKGYCGLNNKDEPNIKTIAEGAYQMADAMLKARG